MKLVGISGAIIGEKTAKTVNQVLTKAKEIDPQIEVELIDLRDYEVEFVDGRPLTAYNKNTQDVISKILAADAYIIGSPIYQASLSGVLKNLFDHLPVAAFDAKVVGIVTTAGSPRHFLVAENQIKPILSFFKALIATRSVYALGSCFDENNEIAEADVLERIEALAHEVVTLQGKLKS